MNTYYVRWTDPASSTSDEEPVAYNALNYFEAAKIAFEAFAEVDELEAFATGDAILYVSSSNKNPSYRRIKVTARMHLDAEELNG